MTLDTRRLSCIADRWAFLVGSDALQFQSPDPAGRRQWLADLLRRFHYQILPRTDKGTLRAFAQKVGGCSRAQLTRLIAQWLKTGHLIDRRGPPRCPFHRRYTVAGVARLPLLASRSKCRHRQGCSWISADRSVPPGFR